MTTADEAVQTLPPPHDCVAFMAAMGDPEIPFGYSDKLRAHVLRVGAEGSTRGMMLRFCPFCGTELPPALTDEWAAEVASRGLTQDGPLPDDLRSGAWWRAKGL